MGTSLMADWIEKSDLSRTLAALAVILAALPTLCASSLTPWPYLQVYPPVNESNDSTVTPLYFALVLSSGGEYTSIGAVPGVQVALDYVNSQPDILPGYSLHYTLADSQVMRSTRLVPYFALGGAELRDKAPHIQFKPSRNSSAVLGVLEYVLK